MIHYCHSLFQNVRLKLYPYNSVEMIKLPSLNYYKRILKVYLFNRKQGAVNFWHTRLDVDEDAMQKLKNEKIGPYYMDFTQKLKYDGPFDGDGIPMLNYFGDIGVQYNPCAIAQYGLGVHTSLVRSYNKEYERLLLRLSDWFVENQSEEGIWYYHFDWNEMGKPWYSGLAQGQAISLLLRSYKYFKKETYFNAAEKAIVQLLKHESEGGCLSQTESGIWLEEHPNESKARHILNGFIWSTWAVLDYYLVTKEQEYLNIFNEFGKSLQDRIDKYDIGFWSIYTQVPNQLIPMVCSVYYQKLHILQLEIMAEMVNSNKLVLYRDRWMDQLNNPFYRYFSQFIKIIYKLSYK